jgi:hypothetical protein
MERRRFGSMESKTQIESRDFNGVSFKCAVAALHEGAS